MSGPASRRSYLQSQKKGGEGRIELYKLYTIVLVVDAVGGRIGATAGVEGATALSRALVRA